MDYIISKLFGLIGDKKAVTALEYAMIASLIAVACITIVSTLGGHISGVFSTIDSHLTAGG